MNNLRKKPKRFRARLRQASIIIQKHWKRIMAKEQYTLMKLRVEKEKSKKSLGIFLKRRAKLIGEDFYDISVYDRPPIHFLFIAINLTHRQYRLKDILKPRGPKIQRHIKGIFNKANHFINTGGQELVDFLLDIATIKEHEIDFEFHKKQKFSNYNSLTSLTINSPTPRRTPS